MSEPFEQPPTRQLDAPVEIETILGGRGLQAVGLISMFLSAAFFFKLAVDHGWLPPLARVLIGLVAGVAFLISGVVAQRRPGGNRAIVEGLLALGGALCYLSLWAAGPLFGLISSPIAFVSMGAVTCILTVLAAYHRSFLTALYGLIGGLLTPALLPHADQQLLLGAYLIVLCGGMLKLADDARFKVIPIVAFAGSLYYLPQFEVSATWSYVNDLILASMFFLEFAVSRFAAARRAGSMSVLDVLLNVCNVLVFTAILELDLAHQSHLLAGMLVALCAVLVAGAFNVRAGENGRVVYFWSGALVLALAVPAVFIDHPWMMAGGFAIEGLLMYALGVYRGYRDFKLAGLFVATISVPLGVIVMFLQPATPQLFFDRIETYAMLAVTLFALANAARDRSDTVAAGGWEADLASIAVTFANVIIVAGIGNVVYMLPDSFNVSLSVQQLITSVSWIVLAGIIFAVALRRNSAVLRWQSLALFLLTIAKVVIVDLASMEIIDRAGVCFGLGVATLIVSAVYLRRIQKSHPIDPGPASQAEANATS